MPANSFAVDGTGPIVSSEDASHDILLNAARREKQRAEAKQNSVKTRETGCGSPRQAEDQVLLLHEKAVGDNGSFDTGSQGLGERCQ